MAINWQTILSSFDDKPTLLQWLKKVEEALKDASVSSITLEQPTATQAQLVLHFADGTSLTSPTITLPIGPQGIQGPKGDTGATGEQGPQGVQGEQGVSIVSITSSQNQNVVRVVVTLSNSTTQTFSFNTSSGGVSIQTYTKTFASINDFKAYITANYEKILNIQITPQSNFTINTINVLNIASSSYAQQQMTSVPIMIASYAYDFKVVKIPPYDNYSLNHVEMGMHLCLRLEGNTNFAIQLSGLNGGATLMGGMNEELSASLLLDSTIVVTMLGAETIPT